MSWTLGEAQLNTASAVGAEQSGVALLCPGREMRPDPQGWWEGLPTFQELPVLFFQNSSVLPEPSVLGTRLLLKILPSCSLLILLCSVVCGSPVQPVVCLPRTLHLQRVGGTLDVPYNKTIIWVMGPGGKALKGHVTVHTFLLSLS